jgi:hypothetical protein
MGDIQGFQGYICPWPSYPPLPPASWCEGAHTALQYVVRGSGEKSMLLCRQGQNGYRQKDLWGITKH